MNDHCPICQRPTPPEFQEGHIVPKVKGGTVIVQLCVDCHRQLHHLFTNPELKYNYSTLELILAEPKIQTWIKFARKQARFGICMASKKKR